MHINNPTRRYLVKSFLDYIHILTGFSEIELRPIKSWEFLGSEYHKTDFFQLFATKTSILFLVDGCLKETFEKILNQDI